MQLQLIKNKLINKHINIQVKLSEDLHKEITGFFFL